MRLLELFSGTHSIGIVAEKMDYDVVSLDRDLGAKSKLYDYESKNHIKADIMTWDYKKDYKRGDFDIITASPVCLFWSRLRFTWIGRKSKTINPDGSIVKKEDIQRDIDLYGKPMVDKCFEIIEYFKPKYWWLENPQTGLMKNYIEERWNEYNTFYDVDYCKYSNWGYMKKTRFWTNIKGFKPKLCKMDCENIITIKTQAGAVHTGTGKPIKSETRTLHKNPIGDAQKAVDKKIHKVNLSNGYEMIDGKMTVCNTKEKREKLREIKKKDPTRHKKRVSDVGGGSNRLERYRIPEKLIEELLENCQNV